MVLPVRSKVGSIQATRPEKNSFTLLPVKRSTKLEHSKHKSLSCVMLRHGRSNVLMRSTGEHRKDLPRRIRPPWPAKAANQMATAADRMSANADRRAEAAQFNAQAALNRIGTAAEQIESRIANMDKYRLADQAAVSFAFNSDALSEQDMSTLDAVATSVATPQRGYLIELQGFTDNIGTEKYNLELSDRRVESVLRYLVTKRVPLYRISLVGLGTADPVSDNQIAEGRAQNRRVEIRVLRSSDSVSTAAR